MTKKEVDNKHPENPKNLDTQINSEIHQGDVIKEGDVIIEGDFLNLNSDSITTFRKLIENKNTDIIPTEQEDIDHKKFDIHNTDIAKTKSIFEPFDIPSYSEKEFQRIDTKKQLSCLQKRRFIIIESPLEDTTENWCGFLLSKLATNKNYVIYHDSLIGKINIFNAINQENHDADKNEAIVVYLDLTNFKKVVNDISSNSKRYSHAFKVKNRFVIFLFSDEGINTLNNDLKRRLKESVYFQVDFIRDFLQKHHTLKEIEILKLEKQLRDQRIKGLWGDKNNNNIFYSTLLSTNNNLLNEIEIRSRYNPKKHGNSEMFIENFIKKIKISTLVPLDDCIKKTALFIATYFQNIKLYDFTLLINFLAEKKEPNEKPRIKKTIPTKQKRKPINPDKNDKGVYSFKKDWYSNKNKLFKEIFLTIRKSNSQIEFVDFKYIYLRKDIKEYFENSDPLYLQDNFHYLLNSNFLLSSKGSKNLTQEFVKLLALMAAKDPENYGRSLLLNIVNLYIYGLLRLSDNSRKEITLEEFLRKKEVEGEIQTIVLRLADLINEMLDIPHLVVMVNDFFNDLVKQGLHRFIYNILIEINNRQVFSSDFDILKWIKEIIIHGEPELKKKTYDLLLTITINAEDLIYDILKTIKSWKKESIKEDKIHITSLFEFSHLFITELTKRLLNNFEYRNYGDSPSTYLLFSTYDICNKSNKDNMNLLVSHLFDENIPIANIIHNINIIEQQTVYEYYWKNQFLLANFIEEWYIILHFNTHEEENKNNQFISDLLFDSINKNTSRLQQKGLLSIWRKKRNNYLNIANRFNSEGKKKNRAEVKIKRKYLTQLISDFSNVLKLNK